MTPFRAADAIGRDARETIFVAGAVGFFIAAVALVTAADGLALAWAAIPASSSCSLFECVGRALDNLLALPGLFFGTSAVAATVGGTVMGGGIGGATYGNGLGSGGSMGTEGERSPGDRLMKRDSVVYDDHGRPIPGTHVPEGTGVPPTRTIYAPNGNPMFHRVVIYGGKLPPGVPRTGWVDATDTRPQPAPENFA